MVDFLRQSENILRYTIERFFGWGGFSSATRLGLDWPIALELLNVLTYYKVARLLPIPTISRAPVYNG